jgi:hypothetical protein
MPSLPTLRERRTILVASTLALLVLAPTKLIPAWRAHRGERHAATLELTAELVRAEASVSALPWLRDSLVARRERYLALAPRLLSGESPSAAGASLASLVSGNAQAARLRLGSIRMRSDSVALDRFAGVSVETELTGDIHGVSTLLHSLESGAALLRVRRLVITQPEPAAPSDRPEALRVELVVEGIAITRSEERSP